MSEQRREPFMPIAEVTDDMLIDTGSEIITWGELKARRDTDGSPKGTDPQGLDGEATTAGAGTASPNTSMGRRG